MNVQKVLLRRRRFLQKQVNGLLEELTWTETEEDRYWVGVCLHDLRAEIKWLNYLYREVMGRGRVR